MNGEEYLSYDRGVKPLLYLLDTGISCVGAIAADKTVGAGAAHLYVLLGVKSIWTNIISLAAERILTEQGIEVFYGESVPHIINRRGDGICPIEEAVSGAHTSVEALELIRNKLKELQSQ